MYSRCNLLRVPGDLVPIVDDPVVEIVVLRAPAPEQVGEAVDVVELLGAEGHDAAEDVLVGEVVVEDVDG